MHPGRSMDQYVDLGTAQIKRKRSVEAEKGANILNHAAFCKEIVCKHTF